jgi:UDP-MurNAc hydroxylase
MRLTCTGHAGLLIETRVGSILCDPWRSPAYFASWFPFPDNSAVDFASMRPDFLYISHLHRDHFDPELLRRDIPRSTPVLLPDYPTDDLRGALEDLGFHSFVTTESGVPLELGGLRVMITAMSSPADGPIGDSALSVDDGEVRILNQNDAHPPSPEGLREFGDYDGHLLQYSGAIWYPLVYEYAPRSKSILARAKRANGMARARQFIEAVGARHVFPNSGPACFLDPALYELNDFERSDDNIFPDQVAFIDYLRGCGLDNAHLLIPASTAELTREGCTVSHPVPEAEVMRIFTDKRTYLDAYAARQRQRLEAEWRDLPAFDGDLVSALAEWWEPLLELADQIRAGIDSVMLLDLGDEKVAVDFTTGRVRRWQGERVRYRFTIERRLVEALVARHETDWVNSLFLSLRFSAYRRGPYNEFVYSFFKCLAKDRLSFVEGWYAERQQPGDMVRIGDYLVQRRCPHMKSDLAHFGHLEGSGVLQCGMHGWRWDLSTGRCLTATGHPIAATRAEDAGETVGEEEISGVPSIRPAPFPSSPT